MREKPVTTARGGGSFESVGVRRRKSFPLLVLETDPSESEPGSRNHAAPLRAPPSPLALPPRLPRSVPLSPTPLITSVGCREKWMPSHILSGHQALNP